MVRMHMDRMTQRKCKKTQDELRLAMSGYQLFPSISFDVKKMMKLDFHIG